MKVTIFMEKKSAPSLKNPEILFLTFFGVGLFPKAPGTAGTLACLPLFYFAGQFNIPYFFFLPFLAVMILASSFIADYAQKKFQVHDPSWVVIDEVIGMFTAWLFIQEHNIIDLIALCIFFRIFDIVKVWPASYFDKEMRHGAGTILDDVMSGIMAGVMYLLFRLLLSTFAIQT